MYVTYAVYDDQTGDIIHVHVEDAELQSSENDIRQLAGVQSQKGLKVLRVEGGLPPGGARVVQGELQPVEGREGPAAGSGGSTRDIRLESADRKSVV